MSKAEAVLPYAATHRVRDTCYCLHAQRAARALARRYDEALRPFGLTNGQFSLLMALNRPVPARIADVTALLAMDRTTLTANLKPLERRGLLGVEVDPADKRGRLLRLRPAGHAALIAALPVWQRMQAVMERKLKRRDGESLRADLRALA